MLRHAGLLVLILLARWLGRDLLLKCVGHSNTFQAIEKGIA